MSSFEKDQSNRVYQTGGNSNVLEESYVEAAMNTEEITENPTSNNMNTPVNKKTKKKRLKKCLKSASKSNLSFSFLNSSAVKQSLRANNRALALNLQRCRHELKMVTQENVELQKTIKELEMRVLTLERVAGLKDAEIETEVERRLQETAMAMIESEVQLAVNETYRKLKDMLVKAGQSLYEASSSITQALNECIETPRRSTISSFRSFRRGTSICSMGSVRPSISEDDMRSPSTARLSSQAIHVPESDLPMQAQPPEGVEFQSHDISIIMEQPSMITDGMEQYLPDKLGDIDSVPEETTEDEAGSLSSKNKNQKKGLSKLPLPQRVPRKGKDIKLAMEIARTNLGSSDKDFPILASKSDSVLVIDKDKDSQSTEVDRRKTFLLPSQPQKSPTSQSQDRRGTFVVEKNLEKEENLPSASQIDRRGTFILPQKSQECTILPEVTFPEGSEHTMIFNTDMEMTEVLDPVHPISCNVSPVAAKESVSVERVSLDNSEVRNKLEGLKKKTQKGNEDKEKDPNTENDNRNSNKKTGHDAPDNTAKSAVECRVTKPGKIVFSATRKDLDGFRKPVPVKKPKSKSTVKLSKGVKSLKGQKTPVKPVSVFDFHDKTPNVNAGKAPDVYNISVDEPVVTDSSKTSVNEPAERDKQESSNNRKSRSRTRERKGESSDGSSQRESPEKSQSRKAKEPHTRQEELVDGMIYHLPLKGCTPEKPVSNTRGRSRSRGRKSYKDFFDESDVESPATDANKRSKSRSKKRREDDADFTVTNRGRSKSKGPVTNNDESEEKLNTKRSKSRARSRTRMAEEDSGNTSVEIVTAEKNTVNESGSGNEEGICSPDIKVRSRSRGRSRTRKGTQIAESESQGDEDVELRARNSRSSNNRAVGEREESPEVRSRGRSRSRKTTQMVDQPVMENQDRDEEVPVRNLRSNSRTRSKVQSSSEEGDEKDKEREVKRSRGYVEENVRTPRETRKSVRRSKSRTSVADDIENEKSDKEVENLVIPDSDESIHLIEDEAEPNMVLPSSDENIDVSEKNVGSRRKSVSKRKSVCLNDSDECIDLENLRKSVNRLNRSPDSDNFVKQSTLESLEFQNPALCKKPQSTRKRKKIEGKEKCSKKDGEIIIDKETASTDGSAMDRLGMISVRDRTKEAPFINDEELTFSDFDKMYQAKRTQSDYEKAKEERENVEKNKHNRTEVEDTVQRTSKSTKKRKLASSNNKICETPKSKTVVPAVQTGKAKSRGSSKKKKDGHHVDDVSQSTEKENKGLNSAEMSVVDKLKLIKEKISMAVDKDKTKETQESFVTTGGPKVLNDVGNQMSELNTPVVNQRTEFEPSAKRSCRGVKKDYKEASLNVKMRREDFMK